MTKRAIIIVSALIILPIIVAAVAVSSVKIGNPVVAEWDDDRTGVIYNGEHYSPVGKVGERKFEIGEYLGRIADSFYGSPLYRVKGDSAGYLCYAMDGKKLILLSKTGLPLDGMPDGGIPGELILGKSRIDDPDDMALLRSLTEITDPENVTDDEELPIAFSTKKYKGKYTMYKIWEFWGGSAVALDSGVRLFHMSETDNWYFVTAEDAASAEAEEAQYYIYTARPLKDDTALSLILRLTGNETEAGDVSDTAESTGR